eukprot:4971443-Pyramimonas_sp.AAC.1
MRRSRAAQGPPGHPWPTRVLHQGNSAQVGAPSAAIWTRRSQSCSGICDVRGPGQSGADIHRAATVKKEELKAQLPKPPTPDVASPLDGPGASQPAASLSGAPASAGPIGLRPCGQRAS